MADFSVRHARREDLAKILVVQQTAFGRVAAGLGIPPDRLPPLRETLAELERLFDAGMRFYVAESPQGAVVGSVRAEEERGSVEIGRLVVDTGWQRRGVASTLMDLLEADFPDAKRYVLFTATDASVPLALYAKRGYRAFRTEDMGEVVLVWLQKSGPAAVS